MLLSSGYSEFSGESNTTIADEVTHINTTVTSDLETLESPPIEIISQIPVPEILQIPEQEIPQNPIEEDTQPLTDQELSGANIESDQLRV